MFDILKNKQEALFTLGNLALLVLGVLSFFWFIFFSLHILNQALELPTEAHLSGELNLAAFEKVKGLFQRNQ